MVFVYLLALFFGFVIALCYMASPENEAHFAPPILSDEPDDDWECAYCGTGGLKEFERCPNCGAV